MNLWDLGILILPGLVTHPGILSGPLPCPPRRPPAIAAAGRARLPTAGKPDPGARPGRGGAPPHVFWPQSSVVPVLAAPPQSPQGRLRSAYGLLPSPLASLSITWALSRPFAISRFSLVTHYPPIACPRKPDPPQIFFSGPHGGGYLAPGA